MVEITATTKHKVAVPKKVATKPAATNTTTKKSAAPTSVARRGLLPPPLKPATLQSPALIQKDLTQTTNEDKQLFVNGIYRKVMGEQSVLHLSDPHAASTTRDRAGAAADLAVVAKEWGMRYIWKDCGIGSELQRNLFPHGIEALICARSDEAEEAEDENVSLKSASTGLKPSASALSLCSMDNSEMVGTSVISGNSENTKHPGKTTPPNVREGSLLLIRAFCEIVGRSAEPYLVGAFVAAALEESASASLAVRKAAEDSLTAMITLANPWAVPSIMVPLLLQAIHSNEWRIKTSALERLAYCATTAPTQIYKLIPTLIPAIASQVWVTKAQVSMAARAALFAICGTNTNPDIRTAIPAIVQAICKPSDTNKAVSELMGTTFIVPVDAPTLAILCPVLARALKEKLAIHKRAACLVISNMSKLVDTPQAIAPFSSLLVPELKRVSENVQFEEIRDEALKALAQLTKALGSLYTAARENENEAVDETAVRAEELEQEKKRVEAEQLRIKVQRQAEQQKEEQLRIKEEEEKRRFKEAMDAQRELEKLAANEAEAKRQEEELKRERQKLSTKSVQGKCQSCGLKKCKKSCMFFVG